jgi:hypothetical protein
MKEINREYVLSILASLTLCDHMGDVLNDCQKVLDDLEIDWEWDGEDELRDHIAKEGIKTLWGTSIGQDAFWD